MIIMYSFMYHFSQIRAHSPLQQKEKYSTALQNDKKKALSLLTHWGKGNNNNNHSTHAHKVWYEEP